MGMVYVMRRVDEATLEKIRRVSSDDLYSMAMPDDDEALYTAGQMTDLDKSWHAIHFLLTNTEWDDHLPQGFLLGGEEIGEDQGYGPFRVLTSKETKEVDSFLSTLPDDYVALQFNFDLLQKADIYPNIWDRKDPGDVEYVESYFTEMRKFVKAAASAGEGLVLLIS